MEYHLIESKTAGELSAKVSRYLKEGFSLYGNPFATVNKYYQAVAKLHYARYIPNPFKRSPGSPQIDSGE